MNNTLSAKPTILFVCLAALLLMNSCAGANILLNGGFTQLDRYWDTKGNIGFGDFYCPDGDGYCAGSGSTTLYQQVGLSSSAYKLDFAGFYRICYLDIPDALGASGSLVSVVPGQVDYHIVVDGIEVAGVTYTGPSSISYGFHDTGWCNSALSWSGHVNSTVGVSISVRGTNMTYTDGQGGWCSYVDAVSLDATPVPEPATILSLFCGVSLSSLLMFRGRKR